MKLRSINLELKINDTDSYLNISSVHGTGSIMFHITTNRRHSARIWIVNEIWRWDTPPKSELTADDIAALVDVIEFHWRFDKRAIS